MSPKCEPISALHLMHKQRKILPLGEGEAILRMGGGGGNFDHTQSFPYLLLKILHEWCLHYSLSKLKLRLTTVQQEAESDTNS